MRIWRFGLCWAAVAAPLLLSVLLTHCLHSVYPSGSGNGNGNGSGFVARSSTILEESTKSANLRVFASRLSLSFAAGDAAGDADAMENEGTRGSREAERTATHSRS